MPDELKAGNLAQPFAVGFLIVEHANGEQSQVVVPRDSAIFIGRSPGNQVHIYGAAVSRNHVKVTAKGNEVFVWDLTTPAGTLLNGVSLGRGGEARLQSGDVLTIGKTKITFQSV